MSPPLFGKLPSVNELLDSPPLKQLVDRANRHSVVAGVGRFLERMREDVRAATADIPNPVELAERIASWLASAESTAPRPAINATGDFLQLDVEGGAPLSDAARDAVAEVARGSGVVAGDLACGRGDRDQAAEQRACELAGAEAAALFPAGPGALLVTLAALSAGQGTAISRGQILELDGIPLPDLVAASRARLLEVGTTNVTRLADFAAHALPPETALFLVLAPRNYRFAGEHFEVEHVDRAVVVQVGSGRCSQVVVDTDGQGIELVDDIVAVDIARKQGDGRHGRGHAVSKHSVALSP